MSFRRLLDQTAHRPWPLPSGPWFMSQRWCDLLFAHWRVPVTALQPLLPDRLELDTWDGDAWIAAVPFRMEAVRPRFLPSVPGLSAFPELNLRTYVRLRDDPDDKPGVFFFSLDAHQPIAVAIARRAFALPYFRARMSCRAVQNRISYSSERTHQGAPAAVFAGTYQPDGEVFRCEPETLEEWLTERYCLYAWGQSVGRSPDALYRSEVHHVRWPLQPAQADIDAASLLGTVGLADAAAQAPHLLFARSIDVVVWRPERV